MVIKTVQMGIPILVSRSGFTAWGVELARQAGLTLIGRAKGRRFVALAGAERIVFDGDPRAVAEEPARLARKASLPDGGRGVNIVGLLLAGGQSRRMGGGDKALRPLGGRSLLDHVIERMRPQVAALVLNANGDPARFAGFGLPVVADSIPDFAGPLAGVLAGLDWAAAHRPDCPLVVSVADRRAVSAERPGRRGSSRRCEAAERRPRLRRVGRPAASGRRDCGRCGCATDLRHALVDEEIRKVDALDRPLPARDRAVSNRSAGDRPVLQRQPARGPRRAAALLARRG